MFRKKIKILWENKDYVAIDKPAGLIVHPDGKTKEHALTEWIIKKYPKLKNVGESVTLSTGETIRRPGVVHRIDRDTSGVLIVAKSQRAYTVLKKQFKRHEVRKVYHAFVYGKLKEREGKIDRPIARSKSNFRLWSTGRGLRGEPRDALTYYRVLGENNGATFVEIRPQTGRTHQIRVHFKAIGHPVVSDDLYAPDRISMLGFKRLALHARSIRFKGISGEDISISSPYPDDFTKAIKEFGLKIA